MVAAVLLAKPVAKVDDMTDRENGYGKTTPVVEGFRHGVSPVFAVLAALLTLIMGLGICPAALADDPADGQSGTSTFTDDITDTDNLLGADLAAVSDAIAATRESTGVSVRLMYLPSFGTEDQPEQWAASVLESMDPERNTVMLAVASGDGNLVVAVSSNSDEWLRRQQTVEELSDAAAQPLQEQSTPDWAGAATAMMDELVKAKQTSTSSSSVMIGVLVLAGVLAALVAVIVVTAVIRSRRKAKARAGKARRRHKAPAKRS